MMIPRKLLCCGHWVPPLLIGLCIGVVLNLISLPFIEEDCENPLPNSELDNFALKQHRRTNALESDAQGQPNDAELARKDANIDDSEELNDAFEPKLVSPSPKEYTEANAKFTVKKDRPRFAATELEIREKLFLIFLTSAKTVGSLAVAINKTLPSVNNLKVAFFMGPKDKDQSIPEDMPLVHFTDLEITDHTLIFHTMKFLAEHYGDAYDWFAFFPDTTYLRGEKFFNFVSDLSIARDLFLGEKKAGSNYCTADGGLVLSSSLLMKASASLEWCRDHAAPRAGNGINLGRCIEHVSNVKCRSWDKGLHFKSFNVGKVDDVDFVLEDKSKLDGIHQSVSIYPMTDAVSVYKMHRHISQWELNETRKEIDTLKKEIEDMSVFAPGGQAAVPWPIGSAPQYKSKNRFHTIRWDFFTETHTYFKDEWSVATPHTGADHEDIADAVARAKMALHDESDGRLEYTRLISGYRRFDPVRGMEYMLDIMATDSKTKRTTKKRVEILKPLGEVELVPMPYVTENSRVNLIIPVNLETKSSFPNFMEKFAHIFMEGGENIYLFIAFFYTPDLPMTGKADPYALLKSVVTYYENKHHTGAKISWINIQTASINKFVLIDNIAKKLTPDSLIFLSTPGTDLDLEFINRVRMNTVEKWQVYFPIAFWQYKPNLVYDTKPYPTTIEVNEKYGHFDKNKFAHASFYLSDYNAARSEAVRMEKDRSKMDLYDLFLQCHNVHVFRATEPNLCHHFVEHHCNPFTSDGEYHRCLASRASGLASSRRLALLLLEAKGQGHGVNTSTLSN